MQRTSISALSSLVVYTTCRRVPVLPLLLLLGVLIGSATAVAAATSDPVWHVVRSDADGLVVVVEPDTVTWTVQADPVRGRRYDVPHLGGFAPTGDPGTPALPGAGGWIIVPDGTRPVVVPHQQRWRSVSGRRLPPVPVPVLDGGTGQGNIHEELLWRGEVPLQGSVALPAREWAKQAAAPSPGLRVGRTVRWRDRLVAPVTCLPLDATADGKVQRLLAHGEWEIRFVADTKTAVPAVSGAAGRGDARFTGLFLNGELLRRMPTGSAAAGHRTSAAVRRGTLLAPEIRLPVTRTGFQRITARQLQDAGLLPTGVMENQLRLYQRRMPTSDPLDTSDYLEIDVPLLVEGDGDEFSGDDAIVFYGLRPRDDRSFTLDGSIYPDCGDTNETYNPTATDPVNGGNIYYLAVSEPPSGEGWARMGSLTLPAASAGAPQWYLRSDDHERDLYYDEAPVNQQVDRNHWNSRFAATATFALDPVQPAAAGPHAWLEIGLFGYGTSQRSVSVALTNGTDRVDLGTVTVSQTETVFADSILALIPSELSGWELEISRQPSLACYLDWFRLVYPSLYRADGNALLFHAGEQTGSVPLRVAGFEGGPLVVFDISDPRRPRRVLLQAENVVAESDGTLTLSLQVDQTTPRSRRFQAYGDPLALALPTYPVFLASRVTEGDDPLTVGTAPDVVAITHPDLQEQARQWADWRSSRLPGGLEIHVVDVHALYDRFSGGLKHPIALKRFCQYALDNWGSWALVIFGDASENVRGLRDTYNLRDLVPSHWHIWRQVNYTNEVLPSDEWFVNPGAGPDYPFDTQAPPSMLVGRFPAANPDELQTMLDKLMRFEAADAGEAWKSRALCIADDAWSDGYDIAGVEQNYSASEELFQQSEAAFAGAWATLLGAEPPVPGLTADSLFVADYLEPLSPPHDQSRNRLQFEDFAEQYVLPPLLSKLNQGAMIVRYQGHANNHLLAHEQIIEDVENVAYRQDIASLSNRERPFLFFGLGCHIGAFSLGNSENRLRVAKSLAEKLLVSAGGGAAGCYASPGYEFLNPNATLTDIFRQRMLQNPPLGPDGVTRWLLGEIVQASEMQFLALSPHSTVYRRAVAQFAILGDPLTVLDAGPPRLRVSDTQGVVADGTSLTADSSDNRVVLTVDAYDEAGIARISVVTSDGTDLSVGVTGGRVPEATTDRHHRYMLSLPVTPYDHDIIIHVFDSADTGDQDTHARFTLHVPVTVELTGDGQPFDPTTDPLQPGETVSFQGIVTTAAYLDEAATLALDGDHVTLSDVAVSRTGPHEITLAFTAEAAGTGTPAVTLLIDGIATRILLAEEQPVVTTEIGGLQAFPNPCRDTTRFLLTTNLSPTGGWIDLYSLAGRHVARVPITPADFVGGGRVIVPWDGRDDRGDALANGVYLYRASLTGPGGMVGSGMQRLVVMH